MNVSAKPASAEKYLTQRLLGESWGSYEGCSRFSVFWRASRLNHLTSSEVHATLGVRVGKHENAFEKLTHTDAEPHKMIYLSADGAIDPSRWPLEYWWPFAGPIPWKSMPWRIRICPACARSCYHSMLFQVPGVHSCPWHRVALIDACPRCKAPFSMGLNDGNLLGVCRCGHDLVDYVATVLGDSATLTARQRALRRHTSWARSSRLIHYLVAPPSFDPHAWRALHAFAAQTLDGTAPCRSMTEGPAKLILERVSLERARHGGWLQCADDYDSLSFSFALPTAWQVPLVQILTNIINKLSPLEQKRLKSDPHRHQTLRDLATYVGVDCIHLPIQRIQSSTLVMLYRLTSEIGVAKLLKAHPMSRSLVYRTFQRILYRGYAAGARSAFAPALSNSMAAEHPPGKRGECDPSQGFADAVKVICRPHQDRCEEIRRARFPWVILSLPNERPASAHIAWTLQAIQR